MRAAVYLLLTSVTLQSGSLDRHPWSGATEISNRVYVVETNTYPELARSLASRLRQTYPLLEDRFGPLKGAARKPMRVALFRTRSEYYFHGEGVQGAVGHFDSTLDRSAIVWRGERGDRGWPVAVHEASHHYLRRRHPDARLPSWYSEGIACYFEGLMDPTTKQSVARLRIRAAKAALDAGEAKLELLLETRARVSRGKLLLQNFAPTRYYGLAWSFVHFLATDARYADGFRRFELRLFASTPGPDRHEPLARRLLEEECADIETLESEWRAHLAALPNPPTPLSAPVYGWELRSENPFVRYSALARLSGKTLPPDILTGVRQCLRDEDIVVRTQAARVAARAMTTDAVGPMTDALDLGDPELKAVALRALAFEGAGEAVPRLLEEHADRDRAIRALAKIGDPRAFPALRRALTDEKLTVATRALCAAALERDPGAGAALHVAIGDREALIRAAARAALRKPEETTRGAGPPVRAWIDKQKIARHLATLRNPRGEYRELRHACRILALARAEQAVPLLQRLCKPQVREQVRLEAIRALVRITGESRGFEAGQKASAREAAYRAWTEE